MRCERREDARHADGKDLRRRHRGARGRRPLGRGARLRGRRRQAPRRGVLHRPAAAQRHGCLAHGPRLQRHAAGHPRALAPDARLRHALAGGHRPCRDRHADGRRARACQGRDEPRRARPRGVHRARLGAEGALGGRHPRPAEAPRRVLRLGPHRLHDGRGLPARRDEGVRGPLRRRQDLPRQAPGELGSAVRDRDQRPRGRNRRGRRLDVALPLPARGRRDLRLRGARRRRPRDPARDPRLHLHCHHAPRDDARRRRHRGSSIG